jgi:uncharacterized membrane protein YdjX (TVP38/TMEM64 family)
MSILGWAATICGILGGAWVVFEVARRALAAARKRRGHRRDLAACVRELRRLIDTLREE